jgi:hypothetical protein
MMNVSYKAIFFLALCSFILFKIEMNSQRNLSPGDEIFLDYGYCSDDKVDNYPDWAYGIPKKFHFVVLSKIMRRVHRFIDQLQKNQKRRLEQVWMNGTSRSFL